jgi:regulatory protein
LEQESSNPEYTQAEKAALQLIARAEQSVFGLTRKLEKRGYPSAAIGEVIANLCETGLLDDRRFARLWLETRIERQTSPWRLRTALCSRGISRNDADYALNETLDEETEMRLLRRFAEKLERKHKQKTGGETIQSLRYMLKSEGFSSLSVQRFFDDR